MKKNILYIVILLAFCLSSPLNLDAQDTISIKEYLKQILPPQEGRKIFLDPTTGLLTITDIPSNHKLIKELIEAFDIGIPQVMIEVKFIEVTMTDIGELGIEWYWYDQDNVGNAAGYADYVPGQQDTGDGILWGRENAAGTYESFPHTGHGFDFYIGKADTTGGYIRAYLHALEEKGKANLLSAPKVTTLSGQMANMEVTKTFPYVSNVELENRGTAEYPIWVLTQTYEEKTIGISLEVTPRVAAQSRFITLDLHPVVDVLVAQRSIKPTAASASYPTVPSAVGWPVIDTRSTQTSIVTKSGETIVLGGLIKEDEKTYTRKVPVLGDIPLLGNLFKYKHINKEKKSLLIFITATLITADGEKLR